MSELAVVQSCPVCGGIPRIYETDDAFNFYNGQAGAYITCSQCRLVSTIVARGQSAEYVDLLIKAWNRWALEQKVSSRARALAPQSAAFSDESPAAAP